MTALRFVLGLTGGIGSGKSTIANMFAGLGVGIVDTDQIAHQLTAPGGLAVPTITAQFGDAFILPSGAMDRVKMRDYVFTHPHKRVQLEQILHPLIRQEAQLAVDNVQGDYVICVIPLLVETPSWKQRLNRILVVDCDEEIQLKRVMDRNKLSEEQVRAIMSAQVSRKTRLTAADDVICNQGNLATVQNEVLHLHQRYLALAHDGK